MWSFMKTISSRNEEITVSFIDVGKVRPSHEFLKLQICLSTLFAKVKFLRKCLNLQILKVVFLFYRDEYEYDLESRRLEDMMLDRYRLSDPYLEHRRLQDLMDRQRSLRLFESRRLDELMRDRHRLKDPELETRRLDDILERKRKIEESERTRLEDILRRKRDLEENDVDKLRLERSVFL